MTLALYIHYPFCKKKCPYCDFNSHVRDAVVVEDWQAAMLIEMRHMEELASPAPLTSIFFGGGTPSLMPPQMVEALLKEAETLWGFADSIEITLEANPTSSESTHFAGYKAAGVNRLSLGVQSLYDKELAFLGREHSAAEALKVLEMVATHFDRYSFDLIYARPGQSLATWEAELRQALPYSKGHVSLYQLTIEPDTNFARVYAKGGFTLPDGNLAADLYELTAALCAEYKLYAYEISNYASVGEESRHNLTYWRGEPYIGIGAGAHGRILDKSGNWLATSTLKSPERWLSSVLAKSHGLEEMRLIPEYERAEEILLGGLRLKEGISRHKVEPALNGQAMQRLQQLGLIEVTQEFIRILPEHALLTERIISEILS